MYGTVCNPSSYSMIIKTIVLCDDRYRFLTSGFVRLCIWMCLCGRVWVCVWLVWQELTTGRLFSSAHDKPALLSTWSTAKTVLLSFSKWYMTFPRTRSILRGTYSLVYCFKKPPQSFWTKLVWVDLWLEWVELLSKAGCANVKPSPIVVVSICSMFR